MFGRITKVAEYFLQISEKAMAPHSSTLAWKIPWMEEPGRLQSMGSLRVGHDWVTSLSLFTFHTLEKEMATHSSVLAWRIPGTGKPGGLPSNGVTQSRTQLKWLSSSIGVIYTFLGGSDCKESACNAGDLSSISGLGRSAGEGNGNPLQYSGLENPMDRGAWQATVDGITES